MLNAQRLHDKGVKLTVSDAFILSFDKYKFDSPDEKFTTDFPVHIDGLRDLQYAQRIFDYVLTDIMTKNDTCDATIRILHKREDGLCLGYIEDLVCGHSILDCEKLFCDSTDYSIEYDSEMPRLCLIEKNSFFNAGYFPDWTDPNIMRLNFHKGERNVTKPCYHYFNEPVD